MNKREVHQTNSFQMQSCLESSQYQYFRKNGKQFLLMNSLFFFLNLSKNLTYIQLILI